MNLITFELGLQTLRSAHCSVARKSSKCYLLHARRPYWPPSKWHLRDAFHEITIMFSKSYALQTFCLKIQFETATKYVIIYIISCDQLIWIVFNRLNVGKYWINNLLNNYAILHNKEVIVAYPPCYIKFKRRNCNFCNSKYFVLNSRQLCINLKYSEWLQQVRYRINVIISCYYKQSMHRILIQSLVARSYDSTKIMNCSITEWDAGGQTQCFDLTLLRLLILNNYYRIWNI